jgi:N-acylglucosamine 2-epimerase
LSFLNATAYNFASDNFHASHEFVGTHQERSVIMKRRQFLQMTGATGALLTQNVAATHAAENASATKPGAKSVLDGEGKIGGRKLDNIIARYRHDLFDDFLPFMEEHIIDHDLGGFMTHANRSGKQITTDKRVMYEGRGIWVYSHLYRTLAPEKKFLEVARKSVEFLLRAEPSGDALWPNAFTREGKVMEDRGMLIAGTRYKTSGQVYGDMFVANGFAEYARASGKDEFTERAINMLLRCQRVYDDDQYAPAAPLVYMGGEVEVPVLPGCRLLGVWMVMIRLATQLLAVTDDKRVVAVADRCIESIMKRHYNADFDLLAEVLNHDFSTPDNAYAQLAYTGHGIETLWMVMAEAVRRKDQTLFNDTARLFRRTIEVAWDDVYQGWFRGNRNVDQNLWILDKACWVQEEVLIGLMMIVEHTGADWAKEWLRRGYSYVIENFPLDKHGYALWDLYPDRRVRFVEDFDRVGHFHHPRHLMLNLEALERMKKRGGAVSGLFS